MERACGQAYPVARREPMLSDGPCWQFQGRTGIAVPSGEADPGSKMGIGGDDHVLLIEEQDIDRIAHEQHMN